MKLIGFIVVVLFGAGGYWYYTNGISTEGDSAAGSFGGGRGFAAPVVLVAPVEQRLITDTIEAIGTSQANESVTLTAKVNDIVSRVNFEDGDYVEKGYILVELANDEQSALLAEARANLEDAETNLRRQTELGQQRLVPESEVDIAKTRADAARARLNSIAARMDDRLVRAPFEGILGFREISAGTLMTNNTPITTLDDISSIKLDFAIPEIHLNAIQQGNSIEAKSTAYKDTSFNGVIRTIGSRVDPVTRSVTIRALLDNKDRKLRPGMLMTVSIVTAERMSLVIPESALMQIADESFVFLAGADNKAVKKVVTIGARRFGYLEVIEGLQEGDLLIIEGAFKLRPLGPFQIKTSNEWSGKAGGQPGLADKTPNSLKSGS